MSGYMPPLPSWAVDEKTISEYFTYGYQVNYDLAHMGFATYLLVAFIHSAVTFKYARRVWWMWLPTLTGLMEAVGYWYRIESVENGGLAIIITSFVAILVPPIILAVVNYEVVGKLLKGTGRSLGWIKPRFLTRFFFSADMTCFLLQCSAAGLILDDDPDVSKRGSYIVICGLTLQFLVFSAFVLVTWRVASMPELRRAGLPSHIQTALKVCVGTILLLLIRNGYRLYEYSIQVVQRDERLYERAIEYYEWEFYVFEWAPVFAVHLIFAVYNFGAVLPSDEALAAEITAAAGGTSAVAAADGPAGEADKAAPVAGAVMVEVKGLTLRLPAEGEGATATPGAGVATADSTPAA